MHPLPEGQINTKSASVIASFPLLLLTKIELAKFSNIEPASSGLGETTQVLVPGRWGEACNFSYKCIILKNPAES